MYWVDYDGQYSEEATQLVQNRQAHPISSRGADQFLEDLCQRINRLDQISRRKERLTFLRSIRYSPFSRAPLPQSYRIRDLVLSVQSLVPLVLQLHWL